MSSTMVIHKRVITGVDDDVIKYIEQLQAELEKHRWIPVSERLPESSGVVLVLLSDGNIIQAISAYWVNYKGWLNQSITHWKPIILPEPEKVRT